MQQGTEIECINDKGLPIFVSKIKKGDTYTVRGFDKGYRPEGGHAPCVLLEEVKNIVYRGHEIGYDANRFRELTTIPTPSLVIEDKWHTTKGYKS